ncbi:MAG: LD-carboxypeptidase [Ignavibacteriae bacterium]|nr:LD-carboxypeptidase [Ignavibacteriota bacterium]
MITVKPGKLNKGDLIGVVSPASSIADSSRIESGVRYLERLGYSVRVGDHVGKVHGYLAGDDADRLSDLQGMFTDTRVKAVVCIRGGYGTSRLLSWINYRLVARNPKILVGFSDITALQLALLRRCGLITFHGPMLGVEMANTIDPFTEEMFWILVSSTTKIGKVAFPASSSLISLHGGRAVGRLIGGNLSMMTTLMGTHFLPDMRGSVLCIEEIDEEPYRIDRMLTHLRNAAVLDKVSAIIAGQFTDCLPKDSSKPSLTVEEVLAESAKRLAKPFLANLPFGHIPLKVTLPIGLKVRVDADAGAMEFLEAAVR